MQTKQPIILQVKDLKTYFYTSDGTVPAVDGVSLHIEEGETLGVVGESGCGKSVTALSIMRLIASPGKIISGEILFQGTDLLQQPESAMYMTRGAQISMVFQEPMTSLNPVYTIGDQISEALTIHQNMTKEAALARTVELLKRVRIPEAEKRVKSYPHELSGGMRQRVMIAMAMACTPSLLIADEATTALDVTIQAQILELLKDLRESLGLSIMLITHDLGVVAEMAERVVVMYVGKIVEEADVYTLFQSPKHPYTQALLSSIPTLQTSREQRLNVISGTVPNLYRALPPGCRFAPRCPQVFDRCRREEPPLIPVARGQTARCWLYDAQSNFAPARPGASASAPSEKPTPLS
ncbi:MAG: ABC transporter ATP-binding protein [Chloroflexota bacterium]|nr:ABC transporter ATP-binding protein [Chloroflexota bacterium]